jgi:C-terminal processing protease CtpA/Prc
MRPIRTTFTLIALVLLAAAVASAQNLSNERGRFKAMLNIVSDHVEKNFYDPGFKGVNWQAAVEEARAKIESAQTVSDMATAIFTLTNKLQDSHTVFLPPERVEKPLFGFNAKAVGNEIYIYEITKKGAAERAGLKMGDRLITVNGYNALRENFDLMMLYFHALRPAGALDIVYQRGKAAPASLRLVPDMKRRPIIDDLTQDINLWALIRESTSEPNYYGNYDGGIGYVKLADFIAGDYGFTGLMKKIKDSKAVIVDMRGNPGGAVETLREFIGYFEQEPVVVADVVTRKKREPIKVKPQRPNFSGPMFILIDSQTGSASEIFAKHFQSTGRAKLLGDKTAGRVTVARFFGEASGMDTVAFYGVQVAVGRAIFPDGTELEKNPVTPDISCLPTGDELREDRDRCFFLAMGMARKSLGLPEAMPKKDEGKK